MAHGGLRRGALGRLGRLRQPGRGKTPVRDQAASEPAGGERGVGLRRPWTALTVCAALLVAAELGLRAAGLGDPPIAVLDEQLEYRLVPDAAYRRWGNRIEIGGHGFRAPDLAASKGAAEARLLLIGDSVVYGNHFLDQEETIAIRLSALLSSPSCTVRVLPMAVSSWGPVNQAAALDRSGTFEADEIAIVLSGHDAYDTPEPGTPPVPYRLSPPAGAIGDLVAAVAERLLPRAGPDAPGPPLEARLQASLAALDRIARHAEEAGAELLFVYHPTVSERLSERLPAGERLLDWARGRGLDRLDLGTVAQIGYRDDIHPDAAGAARIAAALAQQYRGRLDCGD